MDKHTHSYVFLLVNLTSDLLEKINGSQSICAVHAYLSAVCLCECWWRHCLLPEWIWVSSLISEYTVSVCMSLLGVNIQLSWGQGNTATMYVLDSETPQHHS